MAAVTEGSVEWIDRDLEARKHLWTGLKRLGPRGRIRFVSWAANVASALGTETKVTSHTGTVHESYQDLMILAVTHGLKLDRACGEMESWLKRVP